jgi:hypothetical protein
MHCNLIFTALRPKLTVIGLAQYTCSTQNNRRKSMGVSNMLLKLDPMTASRQLNSMTASRQSEQSCLDVNAYAMAQ